MNFYIILRYVVQEELLPHLKGMWYSKNCYLILRYVVQEELLSHLKGMWYSKICYLIFKVCGTVRIAISS